MSLGRRYAQRVLPYVSTVSIAPLDLPPTALSTTLLIHIPQFKTPSLEINFERRARIFKQLRFPVSTRLKSLILDSPIDDRFLDMYLKYRVNAERSSNSCRGFRSCY